MADWKLESLLEGAQCGILTGLVLLAEDIGLGRHGEEMEMDCWATSSGGGNGFCWRR